METKNNAVDIRIDKGTTHMVVGPPGSGKTFRVIDMIRNKDQLIKDGNTIKNIIFCYSAWQDVYTRLDDDGLVTKWVNKMPSNAEFRTLVENHVKTGSIVVIDDFMSDISKDLVEIVCVSSRHYNTISFILFQNLFPPNPLARQISLNAKYIYIHKNPRENSQVGYLARQINPSNYKWIVAAYQEATKDPFGCFIIDLTQGTPSNLRFRSNILPHELPAIIWTKASEI